MWHLLSLPIFTAQFLHFWSKFVQILIILSYSTCICATHLYVYTGDLFCSFILSLQRTLLPKRREVRWSYCCLVHVPARIRWSVLSKKQVLLYILEWWEVCVSWLKMGPVLIRIPWHALWNHIDYLKGLIDTLESSLNGSHLFTFQADRIDNFSLLASSAPQGFI